MPGLLDFIKTPEGQGLLSAAFGGLAGAGRGGPVNSLGRAGMAGLMGYGNAQDRLTQDAARKQQVEREKFLFDRQKLMADREDSVNALAQKYYTPATQGAPGVMDGSMLPPELQTGAVPMAATPGKPAGFDLKGYANALMGLDAKQGVPLMQSLAKDTPVDKVNPKDYTPESLAKYSQSRNYSDLVPVRKLDAVDGQILDLYDQGNKGRSVPNANKPFSIGPNGELVPNQAYQAYELSKSRAGATNVNVKTDVKTGEGLAKEVGPMIASSKAAAMGSLTQLDTAMRLNQAIDSGKLIAGPGANARIALAQIGDVLGVGGKDNAEILANTRATVQGLAKFSLDGRSALKGQGQISDYEGKLLAKATSGDISELTIPELKVLTATAQRVAQAKYEEHANNMKVMRSKPSLADVADFYDVPPLPTMQAPANPTTGGAKFLGFE